MSEDEKDTLIQVLCPGNVQTSYSQGSGKSSTCNNGIKKDKALVQESEESGDTVIAWIMWNRSTKIPIEAIGHNNNI